jgi:hypothetical protein
MAILALGFKFSQFDIHHLRSLAVPHSETDVAMFWNTTP